jgi:hypothetical protein
MLQNFTYTSRATELGRGNKDTKMSKVPDWTPGPGAYTMPSDFINKQKEKVVNEMDENNQPIEKTVMVTPWD